MIKRARGLKFESIEDGRRIIVLRSIKWVGRWFGRFGRTIKEKRLGGEGQIREFEGKGGRGRERERG